jgi:hypothetical protein
VTSWEVLVFGLALSAELKQFLSFGRHEEMSHLLHGRPLARDHDGVLEVGIVDELAPFLLQPPEELRVERGYDCCLLWVVGDLLLLAPLRLLLLRRLSF